MKNEIYIIVLFREKFFYRVFKWSICDRIKYIMVKVAIHTVLACYLARGPKCVLLYFVTREYVCTIVSQIPKKKTRPRSIRRY